MKMFWVNSDDSLQFIGFPEIPIYTEVDRYSTENQ